MLNQYLDVVSIVSITLTFTADKDKDDEYDMPQIKRKKKRIGFHDRKVNIHHRDF